MIDDRLWFDVEKRYKTIRTQLKKDYKGCGLM